METAKAIKCAVLVVHVYSPPVSFQSAIHSVMAVDVDRNTRQISEKLSDLTQMLNEEYPSVSSDFELIVGEPVSEILTLSTLKRPDLIVMGTKGASKIANVLFGSNTAAIIEKSECPVMCIPQSLPFTVPEKILFATNFAYSDIEESIKLTEIAKPFNASIIFGHVVVGVEDTDEEREVIEKFSNEVKLQSGYNNISGMVISDATVSTGLDLLIEKSGVDMIALSTRKRSVFEKIYNPSITKKYSYHSTIPLLAFHNLNESFETERDFS